MTYLALVMGVFGCVTTRELRFFGRQASSPPNAPLAASQGGDVVSMQGWLVSNYKGSSLSVAIANHSGAVLPMSFPADEYVAKTADGRALALEKADFLTYPDRLRPGDEGTVSLLLPKALAVEDITQLVVKLDRGQTAVVLYPVGARSPVTTAGILKPEPTIIEPARLVPDPAPPIPPLAPVAAASAMPPQTAVPPIGPIEPASVAPVGTVPAEVEFEQELGNALRLEVRWNDRDNATIMASGERQTFYLVPGQHDLTATCRLPFIRTTTAKLRIAAALDQPLRIVINANARLDGATVRLRVWSGKRLIADQSFAPGAHG